MAQKTVKYSRLTLTERKLIEQHNNSGKSIRWIAEVLQRSKSTISTELRRGGRKRSEYRHQWAHKSALAGRIRNRKKRKVIGALEAIVLYYLTEYQCSPDQISNRLKKKYPTFTELHVSTETIYKYIYGTSFKAKILPFLRRKGKKRRSRKAYWRGRIKNQNSIHQRPAKVEERTVGGHWEGDLIVGKENRSVMGTLVERASRYTVLVPLESSSPTHVREEFTKALKSFPPNMRKSLTYDQGNEMSQHERLSCDLGIMVYFADPASPQQRGTNENTNGLIRQYFPKQTNLKEYSRQQIEDAAKRLNSRPRKVLGYDTPHEVLTSFLMK